MSKCKCKKNNHHHCVESLKLQSTKNSVNPLTNIKNKPLISKPPISPLSIRCRFEETIKEEKMQQHLSPT